MPRHGANKTDIKLHLVLFRNMWINPAQVMVLCTNNVKPIMTGLAKNSDIQKLVLPARNSKRTPGVVLMILLTVPAVRQADVRVIHLQTRLLTVLMVRMAVNILVITPAT